jgi:hypothetical protein
VTPPARRQEPAQETVKATAGDAVWKQHRDEIAKRNNETQKRAQVERESRDGIAGARIRAEARRESELLVELNERIAKRRRNAR